MCLVTQTCLTLCNPMDYRPPGSSVHGDSSGTNTRVGCHALLQRVFPSQGWNPGLPYCWWILYQLSHQGSSRILEWVAHPFSRGSSWPRNQTGVSCIAGRFFTSWVTSNILSFKSKGQTICSNEDLTMARRLEMRSPKPLFASPPGRVIQMGEIKDWNQ